MNGFTDFDSEKGIPLAIDPNLIDIPAVSKLAINGNAANGSVNENGITEPVEPVDTPNNIFNPKKPQQSLIQNPYSYFGQMPLSEFIPLMLQQRGIGTKFADISEQALLDEISKEENDDYASDSLHKQKEPKPDDQSLSSSEHVQTEINQNVDIKDADDDVIMDEVDQQSPNSLDMQKQLPEELKNTMTQEEFLLVKKNVLEQINMALNESSLSLEFVSLLLSSTRTSAGISSMSPYLKKTVPPASLNADKIPLDILDDHEKLTYEVIHKGWNLRSLEDCRKLLKQHNHILSNAVKNEYHYWKQISDNISNKDVLFKIKDTNSGKKTLGIKYGYDDSGSCYFLDKGVALLRSTPERSELELVPVSDSSIDLHLNKSTSEQFTRVRIYTKIEQEDDYLLSGQSSLNDILLDTSKDIKTQISRLRFFIFEKELMYQLKKEAAQLLPYGVTVENENKVVLELSNEKIEFESINVDEEVISNYQQEAHKINDKRADLMLTLLNMLLVVMYKKQIWKKLNPSLQSSKNTKGYGKDLILLRAILGKIRHQRYKHLVEKIINQSISDKKEGLMLTTNEDVILGDIDISKNKELGNLQREIALFDRVLAMPRTDFIASLPEKGKIEISLRSSNHCNAIVYMKYTDSEEKIVFDTKFSEFSEFEEFLNFVYSEYLV